MKLKAERQTARMEQTAHLGIFNNGDSLWGLHLWGHKFIMPDFHSERQPRKQQWAQDQNCHLPAKASENLGTMLRSEASSPLCPAHRRDSDVTEWPSYPVAKQPDNILGSVWGKSHQTGRWTYWSCKMRLTLLGALSTQHCNQHHHQHAMKAQKRR